MPDGFCDSTDVEYKANTGNARAKNQYLCVSKKDRELRLYDKGKRCDHGTERHLTLEPSTMPIKVCVGKKRHIARAGNPHGKQCISGQTASEWKDLILVRDPRATRRAHAAATAYTPANDSQAGADTSDNGYENEHESRGASAGHSNHTAAAEAVSTIPASISVLEKAYDAHGVFLGHKVGEGIYDPKHHAVIMLDSKTGTGVAAYSALHSNAGSLYSDDKCWKQAYLHNNPYVLDRIYARDKSLNAQWILQGFSGYTSGQLYQEDAGENCHVFAGGTVFGYVEATGVSSSVSEPLSIPIPIAQPVYNQ